jgi:hypothetical protein
MLGLAPPRQGGSQEARCTASETVVLLLAGLVFIDGLIHVGAAVDHFAEFPAHTLAFAAVAAVQMAWAAILMRGPSRRVLLCGCAFTAAVVALWIISRTIGVPIAPRAWVPESVGVADLVESAGETVSAIVALTVAISPRVPFARQVTQRITPVLVAVLLVSVLYGVGAHAG